MAGRILRSGSVLLIALVTLSACGFQPLYGGSGIRELSGITVESGQTNLDYRLQGELESFFGTGDGPYRLVLETETDERRLGLSAQARARRYALEATCRYVLYRNSEIVHQGIIREDAYFDAPNDPYALITARQAAEGRVALELSRLIARDISIHINAQDRETDGS